MSLIYKAKETVVEWAVYTGMGLIVILALILWSAVPSAFWEKISDAVEKKVLWAFIGLLFLAIVGESVYLIQNYLRAKTILRHFGGILWNNNCEIFCPKEEAPLFQSGQTFNEENHKAERVEVFQCPKCDSSYILKDPTGSPITFEKAKKNFLTQQSLKIKGSITPVAIEEGFDEVTITVLQAFGGTTTRHLSVDSFTGLLKNGTKPAQISYSLELLNKKGYLTSVHQMYVGKNNLYELNQKGREYIVKNNLL